MSGPGKVSGRLDFAQPLAVALGGAIYVPEIKNWRAQKFVPQPPEAKRNE